MQATGSVFHSPENHEEQRCRAIVEQAGFVFVGIMPVLFAEMEPLCLWQAPSGSTCGLPISRITVNEVRARTYDVEAKFHTGGAA